MRHADTAAERVKGGGYRVFLGRQPVPPSWPVPITIMAFAFYSSWAAQILFLSLHLLRYIHTTKEEECL